MIYDLIHREDFLEHLEDPEFDMHRIDHLMSAPLLDPEVPVLIAADRIPDFDSTHILQILEEKYSMAITLARKFGLIIAGGSISRILKEGGVENGDIDLFIVGSNAESRVLDILEFLREYGILEVCVGENTITWTQQDYQVQLILKEYKSISHVLHGFDLGASCVACDGHSFHMTGLGKFAFEKGVNILSMSVRSITYEARILKYFKTGFSVALPYLDISKVSPRMRLPHMEIHVDYCEGNALYGTAHTAAVVKAKRPKRLYDLSASMRETKFKCPPIIPLTINYGQFEPIHMSEKEWYGSYFSGS